MKKNEKKQLSEEELVSLLFFIFCFFFFLGIYESTLNIHIIFYQHSQLSFLQSQFTSLQQLFFQEKQKSAGLLQSKEELSANVETLQRQLSEATEKVRALKEVNGKTVEQVNRMMKVKLMVKH